MTLYLIDACTDPLLHFIIEYRRHFNNIDFNANFISNQTSKWHVDVIEILDYRLFWTYWMYHTSISLKHNKNQSHLKIHQKCLFIHFSIWIFYAFFHAFHSVSVLFSTTTWLQTIDGTIYGCKRHCIFWQIQTKNYYAFILTWSEKKKNRLPNFICYKWLKSFEWVDWFMIKSLTQFKMKNKSKFIYEHIVTSIVYIELSINSFDWNPFLKLQNLLINGCRWKCIGFHIASNFPLVMRTNEHRLLFIRFTHFAIIKMNFKIIIQNVATLIDT